MIHLLKIITILMFSILSSSLLFTGCTSHKQPEKKVLTPDSVKKKIFPTTMYVKKDTPPFKQGESVTVLSINGPLAMTQKGEIALSNLEEQRSTFRLTIHTLHSAKIRILNIKPKYTNGMWLSPGKYHIEVSRPGYQTYKKWIVIYSDKELHIKLKKSVLAANGTLTWQNEKNIFSTHGMIWQSRVDEAEKMTWQAAKEYCANLNITTYGYRSKDFALPNDSELLQLSKATPTFQYHHAVYWSSTIDSNQDSYAKYVNVNSGENSWYKKHGKTYVMCRQHLHYPEQLSVNQLASALMDKNTTREFALILEEDEHSENQRALNALQMAIFLTYGNPIIQNVDYHADRGVLVFELISQNRNGKGEPLYRKEVTLAVEEKDAAAMQSQLMDPTFEPIVEFKVTNGQLSFIGI
ncbi:MAG: DUF1566 domain-containing protein [Sulfurimonadaceae bacterium]